MPNAPAEVTLYVAGSARSSAIVDRITNEAADLGDRLHLSVVDVLEDPARAESDTILTTPTLVRWAPSPVRRLLGNTATLSDLLVTAGVPSVPEVPPSGATTRGGAPDANAVISRAAHELRTPLAFVQGYASTLVKAVSSLDRDQTIKCAESIVRGTTQLQSIIESMLVARALERDGLHLNLLDVDLAQLVQETLRDLEVLTAQHTVAVDVIDDVIINADAAKLRQIITNLVSNAVKFSSKGTTVAVTVWKSEEAAYLSVKDQGFGIPAHQLELVFEQYERLGRTEKGMGLGLYISRKIALAHGGTLTAFSPPGDGTRMELALPRSGPNGGEGTSAAL